MEILISSRNFANVKRMAKIVNPIITKKENLRKKKLDIDAEIESLDAQIASYEAGIKAVTAGLGVEQLVHKVVTSTGKFDANGKEIKTSDYKANDNVVWSDEQKAYVVILDEDKDNTQTVEFEIQQPTEKDIQDNNVVDFGF